MGGVRRALALGGLALGLLLPNAALAEGETVTLQIAPSPTPYGSPATFSGTLTAASPGGVVVRIVRRTTDTTGDDVAQTVTNPDGTYSLTATPTEPGKYLAVAGTAVYSQPDVDLQLRPSLYTRLSGVRRIGRALAVTGRLQPAHSGVLRLTVRGRTRRVLVSERGYFRAALPTNRPYRLYYTLSLEPSSGFTPLSRRLRTWIYAPNLRLGSYGRSVLALERGLAQMRYRLRNVNQRYGMDTYQAVLAFQKVHRMARTGRVGGAFWSAFRSLRVPRAHVARGTHLEVSKSRQVLYEVVRGKVVGVVHVSTGATGNTPVGRWRVYRLGPGGSLSHMYYSMYFLRGFAIHGYHSVPPWPASHGCVRTPLWLAPTLYSRWGRIGTVVYVFG